MIIALDLDGTICEEKQTFSRPLAKLLPGAAESVAHLKAQGHRVILYTARGWAEYEVAKQWLADNKVAHDELLMGKPIVDAFIDDRAVRFTSWPDMLANIPTREEAGDVLNDHALKLIRETSAKFVYDVAADPRLSGPVLEIGPMTSQSSVFKTYPELFVDSRALFNSKGLDYESFDIDPEVNGINHVGDFCDADTLLKGKQYGSILLNHCIEHMERLWRLPDVLKAILKPGGHAFFATPWNFRFHGPRPDCWRISDDGYAALFNAKSGFEIVDLVKMGMPHQPLHPVVIHCTIKKL